MRETASGEILMNPIKNTPLFKSILKHIESLPVTEEELLSALLAAASNTDVKWNQTDVDAAFVWDETPQGSDFWNDISILILGENLYEDDDEYPNEDENRDE